MAVGEVFTLNQDKEFDKLSADMTIRAFSSQGGTLLQQNDVHLSCSQPLFLFDKFGSNQVVEWIETDGRVVNDKDAEVPTGTIIVQLAATPDTKPVRLTEMQVITNVQDEPIDYTPQVAGKILEPGAPIELEGFTVDIQLSTRTRYTFFTTIIGETLDGTNMCNGNSFLECTVGFNLDPVFPTAVPTPRPTLTPYPTGDAATTPCEIASSIGCSVLKPSVGLTCDQLAGDVDATCPADQSLLSAFLEYDGTSGDQVFILITCDKSEYFARPVNAGDIIEFSNRASAACDEITVEMFTVEDGSEGDSISSADAVVPCPGAWTIGNEILPGLKVAYYVSTSDGGNSFNVNALEATVQIDYFASNIGNSPLIVTSGTYSAPSPFETGAFSAVPATIAQRSRAILKTETKTIGLSGQSGQSLDFTMSLSGTSASQFALPCDTASSYQINL